LNFSTKECVAGRLASLLKSFFVFLPVLQSNSETELLGICSGHLVGSLVSQICSHLEETRRWLTEQELWKSRPCFQKENVKPFLLLGPAGFVGPFTEHLEMI
jgi:hypothetical protein